MFALAAIKVEDVPCSIVVVAKVVTILKIKSSASFPFNNFIRVTTFWEESEVTVVASWGMDTPASSDETHGESIHGCWYTSTVLSDGT